MQTIEQATDEVPRPEVSDSPLVSLDSPIGPIEYRPGRGIHFGDTGLNVGAFTTLEFDREEGQPGTFEIDSVNLLILWEPVDWLKGFAEIEIGDLFAVETNSDDTHSDAKVEVERLFGELAFDDSLKLRGGKFQTPIGRWNLVPAEPFVWTAIEPVGVEVAFDEYQTGGAILGSFYPGAETFDYWLYGQFVDSLDADDDPDPGERSGGARVEYGQELDGWSFGSSFLATERNGDWSYLGGLDAQWQGEHFELTSEFMIQRGDIPDRDLWDVYVQGVYELLPGFYAVARYEHYDPSGSSQDANLADLGFAWIPVEFLHFKASYRFTDQQSEEVRRGVSASLSILF